MPKPYSIKLPCPHCGEEEASIALLLGNLGEEGDGCLCCYECDTQFSLDEIRDIIREWAPIVAWIDALPGYLAKEE